MSIQTLEQQSFKNKFQKKNNGSLKSINLTKLCICYLCLLKDRTHNITGHASYYILKNSTIVKNKYFLAYNLQIINHGSYHSYPIEFP